MAPSSLPPPPLKKEKRFNPTIFLLFFSLLRVSIRGAAASTADCVQTCNATAVSYPFGFSPGCAIELNCSDAGRMRLGGFHVRHMTTSGYILLDVPPSCGRPVSDANQLFGPNYAATSKNLFFLRGCRNLSYSGCQIDTSIASQQMNQMINCSREGDKLSCFSARNNESYLSLERFDVGHCQAIFGSVFYAESSLEFSTAEVKWWLNGDCQCSANADCTVVNTTVAGVTGFRCSCKVGFVGDGYSAGLGCLKAHHSRCNSACSSTVKLLIIVGGILGLVSMMFASAYVVYRIRSHSTLCRIQEATRRMLCDTSTAIRIYSLKEINRATANFSHHHCLGTGADGTVYVGKFPGDKLAAIKRLRHRDTDHLSQVVNEIKLISSVSHPNLVRLLGCCIELSERVLVYEFIPNGTLYHNLHAHRGAAVLPWPTRVFIAAESAKAIAYLHSAIDPPIFHRDIKSSNILVDHEFNPKIADFGLSRAGVDAEASHISTAPQGTPGYVDPQYHQNFQLSDKSDVYSFGVVLLELMTAMKVVDFNRAALEKNLATLAVDRIGRGLLEEIVDPVLREDSLYGRMKDSIRKVAELAFQCLAFHRDVRPSMVEVAEELEKIRIEVLDEMSSTDYVDLQIQFDGGRDDAAVVAAAAEGDSDSPVSVQQQWKSEQSPSWSSSSEQCKSLIGSQHSSK